MNLSLDSQTKCVSTVTSRSRLLRNNGRIDACLNQSVI